VLGNAIINTGLVQFDFRQQYSNRFVGGNTLEDDLERPSQQIRAILSKIGARRLWKQFKDNTWICLDDICTKEGFEDSEYLGAEMDQLYEPTFRHKYHDLTACGNLR
jgi:hypothetical protein